MKFGGTEATEGRQGSGACWVSCCYTYWGIVTSAWGRLKEIGGISRAGPLYLCGLSLLGSRTPFLLWL